MSLLAGLLRLLLVLVVVRLVGRVIAHFVRRASGPPARRPDAAPPQAAEVLVRDRVCNTFLPQSRAVRAVIAGREEFFCSAACRDRAGARAS